MRRKWYVVSEGHTTLRDNGTSDLLTVNLMRCREDDGISNTRMGLRGQIRRRRRRSRSRRSKNRNTRSRRSRRSRRIKRRKRREEH